MSGDGVEWSGLPYALCSSVGFDSPGGGFDVPGVGFRIGKSIGKPLLLPVKKKDHQLNQKQRTTRYENMIV